MGAKFLKMTNTPAVQVQRWSYAEKNVSLQYAFSLLVLQPVAGKCYRWELLGGKRIKVRRDYVLGTVA